MKRKSMIIIAIAIVTIATGAFAATTFDSGESAAEEQKPSAAVAAKKVNVEVARVEAEGLTEHVNARGTTAAVTDVTFSAEIPGKISHLGAEIGDRVRKGQVLARIDLSSMWAQGKQAKASYELAEVTHGRLEALGADLATSQKIDEARFNKTGAKARLAAVRADLAKGVIRSNLDGFVTARPAERGEYVGPGTPLYRIVDYRTILIEAQLAETQVARVAAGTEVDVAIDALDKQFEGVVDAVLPAADQVSKTFTVRVAVDNPELAILVGMSARLSIATAVHEQVVVVPQDVVVEGADGRSAFVVVDGVAEQRPVRLGPIDGDRVVVAEGLAPGDELIVLGQRDLTDGQPVRVVH